MITNLWHNSNLLKKKIDNVKIKETFLNSILNFKFQSLVGIPGIEPGSLAALVFETSVFTNFTISPIN